MGELLITCDEDDSHQMTAAAIRAALAGELAPAAAVEVEYRPENPYRSCNIVVSPRTDADGIHLTRRGVPTAVISVPNRYMHSPNEVVSVKDLFRAAALIAAFVRNMDEDTDFTPR